jgi:rRNA maturation endonuclease Nob1
MIQNYNRLIEKISRYSGKELEEINRLVEAKRAKLSGLISREGAAQIVAAELGINFEKEKVKINELMDGMKKVNITGKIIQLFPVREFKKEEREGKVSNFFIADETGNIKVVLWDINHISLVESKKIKEGDVVDITNASLRNSELHLGGFSDIKKSNLIIENAKIEKDFAERRIEELNLGGNFKIRAFMVQAFEPKFFEVCPECGGRITIEGDNKTCVKHGKVIPVKRVLISIVLDDGSASIRAVLFSEQIDKLGLKQEDLENFIEKRKNLLGKEAYFSGSVRQNKLYNNLEFFVSDIREIDVDKLIEVLEK